MNPEFVDDPDAEIHTPADVSAIAGAVDWPEATGPVSITMVYPSAVEAVSRVVNVARYLAGDFRCEHDEPVQTAEGTLFDVASDTLNTLEALDLAPDLQRALHVATYFLNRWVDGPEDPHEDPDDGDELVYS